MCARLKLSSFFLCFLPLVASAQSSRPTRVLSVSEVCDLAEDALRSSMPGGLELQRVTWNQAVRVPHGHLEAAGFLEADEPVNGQLRARVEILVDGESIRTIRVLAVVRDRRLVVVASRHLRPGDVIGETDVALRELPPGVYVRRPLRETEDAVGNVVTAAIAAGEILEHSIVRPPPVVSRRDRVRIVARAGGVEVIAPGEPLQDGALGEVINVVCLASRRTLEARVIGPGVVEVR